MPWYRKVQFFAITVTVIAVSRLGWEIFANDLANTEVIDICGYAALIGLYVNMFAAIYRAVKEWKDKNNGNNR